jgi:hypothetical protein
MMEQLVSGRSVLLTALLLNSFRRVGSLIGLNTRVTRVCESELKTQSAPLTELFLKRFDLFQRSSIGGQREAIDGVVCTLWLGRVAIDCVSKRSSRAKGGLRD